MGRFFSVVVLERSMLICRRLIHCVMLLAQLGISGKVTIVIKRCSVSFLVDYFHIFHTTTRFVCLSVCLCLCVFRNNCSYCYPSVNWLGCIVNQWISVRTYSFGERSSCDPTEARQCISAGFEIHRWIKFLWSF